MRALSEGKASQSRILIILNDVKTITQSELTEWLGVQPGTASEVIGKLEKAGLITRAESEKDKRTCELGLTQSGKEHAEKAVAERKKRYKEMFTCLSDAEKSAALVLFEKINSDWEVRYGNVKPFCAHNCNGHSRKNTEE